MEARLFNSHLTDKAPSEKGSTLPRIGYPFCSFQFFPASYFSLLINNFTTGYNKISILTDKSSTVRGLVAILSKLPPDKT